MAHLNLVVIFLGFKISIGEILRSCNDRPPAADRAAVPQGVHRPSRRRPFGKYVIWRGFGELRVELDEDNHELREMGRFEGLPVLPCGFGIEVVSTTGEQLIGRDILQTCLNRLSKVRTVGSRTKKSSFKRTFRSISAA